MALIFEKKKLNYDGLLRSQYIFSKSTFVFHIILIIDSNFDYIYLYSSYPYCVVHSILLNIQNFQKECEKMGWLLDDISLLNVKVNNSVNYISAASNKLWTTNHNDKYNLWYIKVEMEYLPLWTWVHFQFYSLHYLIICNCETETGVTIIFSVLPDQNIYPLNKITI